VPPEDVGTSSFPLVTQWILERRLSQTRQHRFSHAAAHVRGISKKLALRLDAQQYAAYEGTPPTRPHWIAAQGALVVFSAVLVTMLAGLAVLGGWLVLRDFPSFSILAGVPVLMAAWVLRPRLWSAGELWHELRRDDAPTLFTLLDRVAVAAGTRVPDRWRWTPVSTRRQARTDGAGAGRS